MPGKHEPLHKQAPGLLLLHQWQKVQASSLGSIMPAVLLYWAPVNPCLAIRPRTPAAIRLNPPRTAAAAVAPRNPWPNTNRPQCPWWLVCTGRLSLPAFLPPGHPQLATQCQKPTTICGSGHHAPYFATVLVPGGFPCYRTWRPNTHQQALPWDSTRWSMKEREPNSSNEWQSTTLWLWGGLPPKVHRGLPLPTVPHSGKALLPLQRTRVPHWGVGKLQPATTCYYVCSTRRTVSPRYTEDQHFPLCLPAGESHLSWTKATISAPSVSGMPPTVCRETVPPWHTLLPWESPHSLIQ
jgi:hypothetical protein